MFFILTSVKNFVLLTTQLSTKNHHLTNKIMDLSAFSDDSFDAAAWINLTLKATNQNENKQECVSSLISKLQIYSSEITANLEDTSQQLLAGVPRIMKDVHNLQTEALSLRSKMSEVQDDITQVQNETGDYMDQLERLDGLKIKLQNAKQGLQESDGWGRLTSELEELLERSDMLNAQTKLISLQRSLAAQIGLSGQSEREAQVEGFKNRMEALASPGVVQSFTSGDIEKSKKHVETFLIMNRLPQLIQCYRTVQKNALQQSWSEIVDVALNIGSARYLSEFYDQLINNWQKQQKWCVNVFGGSDGLAEATQVLIELLPALQPNRENSVTNCLKRDNDKLGILQEISTANIKFGSTMLKLMQSAGITDSKLYGRFFTASYDWFMIFTSQYAAIEQNYLSTTLAEVQLVHSTSAESVRALGNTNSKLFQWCEEALQRCQLITQNCALPALIVVLNNILKSFLDKCRKAQQQLHASRSTEQNWSMLQTCITLLQNVGDFTIQLDELEDKMGNLVLEKEEKITQQNEKSIDYRIIGTRYINEFNTLCKNVRSSRDARILETTSTNVEAIFKIVFNNIKPICEYIHDTMLASVFTPIEQHLSTIEPIPNSQDGGAGGAAGGSGGANLPDYSFTPQEFITQVGQYLLTLPQHLEPLLLSPVEQLKVALELCDDKYSRNIPSADILLSLLVDETCAMYEEKIGQIRELNASAAKQLATDIEYLGSVLEELGLSLGSRLQQTAALLRAPAESYSTLSIGCDPKLVAGIRQMRNIVSIE